MSSDRPKPEFKPKPKSRNLKFPINSHVAFKHNKTTKTGHKNILSLPAGLQEAASMWNSTKIGFEQIYFDSYCMSSTLDWSIFCNGHLQKKITNLLNLRDRYAHIRKENTHNK